MCSIQRVIILAYLARNISCSIVSFGGTTQTPSNPAEKESSRFRIFYQVPPIYSNLADKTAVWYGNKRLQAVDYYKDSRDNARIFYDNGKQQATDLTGRVKNRLVNPFSQPSDLDQGPKSPYDHQTSYTLSNPALAASGSATSLALQPPLSPPNPPIPSTVSGLGAPVLVAQTQSLPPAQKVLIATQPVVGTTQQHSTYQSAIPIIMPSSSNPPRSWSEMVRGH